MAATGGGLRVLVLAAGRGKRLRSKSIKLVHSVAGSPMVAHVLDAVARLRPQRIVTVIGFQADEVRAALDGHRSAFVVQREQRGTGHAVLQAARAVGASGDGPLLIVNGDMPTIRPSTLRRFVSHHRRSRAALSFMTAELDEPTGYGRVVRDGGGRVVRVVEQADATAAEKRIREVNCGIYCASPATLFRTLRRLTPDNAQGEYYLTDAVHVLLEDGGAVAAVRHDDAEELLGVNTRQELSRASRTLYARKAEALQDQGVTLLDAERSWIDPRARIGRDTVIYPGVLIEGETVIGRDCVIGLGCRIADSTIGDDVAVRDYSLLERARVGTRAVVGPFARLRPDSWLDPDSRVGNFVELKKTRLGRGSKANHLAYLGDATIGPDCNVGAGTITCNYDGRNKFPTVLGRGVFIGSDTQLVAPVRLGDEAYVGAGSTVTEDVPAGALAISRQPQTNVEGWVGRRKRRDRARSTKK
ncbi:MAG TPA: bifunctional UDP-N-acetylglucosamine diphosphorylase/glucosamine-1-phosphate N-acetyltransferase GlmU [Candidatus Polarisedimenticolaceae bacterium]|nr:bifunctional UDP-N-acetylglucosamine diphosphorylase/glucosamine-1-phosphate N-acetyltransferase GlmU [Candidatus Polarisedimenticolaceae bacterium]